MRKTLIATAMAFGLIFGGAGVANAAPVNNKVCKVVYAKIGNKVFKTVGKCL